MDEGMVPINVITVVNTIHFTKYKSSLFHDPLQNNLIKLTLSVLKFNANKVITSVNKIHLYTTPPGSGSIREQGTEKT